MTTAWANYEERSETATGVEPRFQRAAAGGSNCFLTGMAGTGKSYQLGEFIRKSPRKPDVTAPTGVAALNVGGMTIHRFTGMMSGPKGDQTNEGFYEELMDSPYRRAVMRAHWRVRGCECLIIDEVSMLPARQFDYVEWLFRKVRDREEPWGGCQVILTGDFLQLPPVRTDESKPYDWAFQSPGWERSALRTFQLTTVRRQDEKEFVSALSDFRKGSVWGATAKLFHGRVVRFPGDKVPRIFTHNSMVDRWNNAQIEELETPKFVFEAVVDGPDNELEFLRKNLLTPETLVLKVGALVSFTRNTTDLETQLTLFVNGELGTVVDIKEDAVTVEKKGGRTVSVRRNKWVFNPKDDESASFIQFPLRQAWAMTIHKSQGLTMDEAYIDIRAARDPGQAYVAVSRVKTQAGLQLKEMPKGIHVSPEAIEFYKSIVD